jgi:hypothetical protein
MIRCITFAYYRRNNGTTELRIVAVNVASSVLDPNDHGGAGVTGRAPGEQADPAAAQP